jgi:CRISPR-associated protein Csy1
VVDKVILDFFDERKEAWMKKNRTSMMSDDEVLILQELCNKSFALGEWLPSAANRAGQMSVSTHPCTFSHPSARKNKNGYVTSVIAENISANDGLLRSGNVNVESDALGNAAVLDVHKFLSLKMEDGQTLMLHIEQESILAKKLLSQEGNDYQALRNGLLAMRDNGSQEVITSSKIKQVYFPVEGDYHQLSILSNSGLIYHLKHRINAILFDDKVKEVREKKRKNDPSDIGFRELYNLTVIGYGGTKPQNISVLNNQNGGKAYLLHSMPPVIEKRSIRFPKHNFFKESMRAFETAEIFKSLHTIFKTDYKNVTMRDAKYYWYEQLMERIVGKMWAVRSMVESQYFEKHSQLENHQKIWLVDKFSDTRESEEIWLETLIDEITRWIVDGCEKGLKKSEIFGPAEYQDIRSIVESHKEGLR